MFELRGILIEQSFDIAHRRTIGSCTGAMGGELETGAEHAFIIQRLQMPPGRNGTGNVAGLFAIGAQEIPAGDPVGYDFESLDEQFGSGRVAAPFGQHFRIAGAAIGNDIAGRMKRLGQDEVISGGLPDQSPGARGFDANRAGMQAGR